MADGGFFIEGFQTQARLHFSNQSLPASDLYNNL